MKALSLLVLSLRVFAVFAQTETPFHPSSFVDTIPPEIHDMLKQRLVADKSQVTAKKKEGEYMKALYDQRFSYVVNSFNEDYFVVDHPLTEALRRISDRIYDANPELPRELNVYTFRSSVPNAVSFGEGTIAIMLGLLERLETEDQLAYVLCHEFAHYYARHAERNFEELVTLNYDRELKSQINEIKRSPYGRYAKLKVLFNRMDISITRHNRKSEFQADSLGLVYYLKTGYDRHAPLRVMQILANADKGIDQHHIDLRKYFDFKDFAFKDSWTYYSTSNIVYASESEDESDSLKTHPNTARRFDRLKDQLGGAAHNSTNVKPGRSFEYLRWLASFEMISSHYHFKQYGKALFHSLLLADRYPQEPFAHAIIVKSLYQLYKAQKEHNIDDVLELPHPQFDENYNRVLSFINKLRLHEIANIAYEYATSRPAEFYTDEEFIHALWQCSRLEFSKVDHKKVAEEYESLFPDGRYLNEMKEKK